jgi:DNA-binding CsgD family transcriptional regulator
MGRHALRRLNAVANELGSTGKADDLDLDLVELVLALDGGLGASVLDEVLRTLGSPHLLETAVDEHRVRVANGVVTPAARPDIASLKPSKSRAIHRAIADVLGSDGPLAHRRRRADHLVAATLLPDETVASELATLAAELRADDAIADAATKWQEAAALSPALSDRARRLREAGEALWLLSRTAEAGVVLLEAFAATDDVRLRADIAVILGQIELWTRGPRHALAVLVASADAVADVDPDRAATLLVHAVNTTVISLDVEAGLRFARRACDLAAAGSGAVSPAAQVALAVALAFHGETQESVALIGPLEEIAWSLLGADADAIPELEHLMNVLGLLATMTERWDRGEAYLERVVFRAKSAGSRSMLAASAAILAELRFRSGRFQEAADLLQKDVFGTYTDVRRVIEGEPGGRVPIPDAVLRVWLTGVALRNEAVTGSIDTLPLVRARALTTLAEAEQLDASMPVVFLLYALALCSMAVGDYADAAQHLDRIASIAAAGDVHEPGMAWWQVDHIESLYRSGRKHEAHSALEKLAADVELTDRRSGIAALARSRVLMATDLVEADAAAASSIEGWMALPAPFEVARTLLVRGGKRLDLGDPAGAIRDAEEAAALLERLGAQPWIARAHDLAVTAMAAGDPLSALTEAELRVVKAVIAGMRNREVAELLVVSERTVESHLQRIYRKLGVASRMQLAALGRRD